MIQVKFASPILSTFHTFDSFPNAPGLHFIYIYIHISRERFSSRTKWSLKKRRILQEDEKKPFDACVPFHRSSHKWSRPVYPGVQVTLCICGAPSPPRFRGEPMIYIIDSSSNSTNSRLGRPCLCVLWHAIVLPINRVIVFVLAESRCSGWKTRVPKKRRPFRGLRVQLNLCGIERWRVTLSRKIEKGKRISFENRFDVVGVKYSKGRFEQFYG